MSNPKLRFKPANDQSYQDTVACTLGDISEYTKQSDEQKNCLFIGNEQLISNFGGAVLNIRENAKGIKFNRDDVLLGNIRPYLKKVWLSTQSGIASPDVLIFRATKSIPGYLKCILSSDRFFNHVAQGYKGSKMPRGDKRQMMDFKIQCPCLEEQQKIAAFFITLDEKISLSERKLEALERLKKGLMQNIFTQQIRFKDECAKEFPSWRKISLGEIVRFKNGINAKKNSFGSGIKLIGVSDVLSKNPIAYDSISLSVEVEERIKKDFAVTYGDILFQRSSETVADAGTSNVYLDKAKDAVFGGFVICGKKIADYDPIFVNEALRTYPVRKQIMRLAQGAQHINIGQEALSKVTIDWPCLQEQKKIANLVKELDERIRLVGEKTEALKTLKQGFMQQMFV